MVIRKYFIVHLLFCGLWLLNANEVKAQSLYRHSTSIIALLTDTLGQLYFIDKKNQAFNYNQGIVEKIEANLDSLQLIPSENYNFMFYDGSNVLSIQNKELFQSHNNFNGNPIYSVDSTLFSLVGDRLIFQKNKDQVECPLKLDKALIQQISYYNESLMVLAADTLYIPCEKRKIPLPFASSGFCQNDGQLYFSSFDSGLWVMTEGKLRKLFFPGIALPNAIKKLIHKDGILWMITTKGQLLTFDLTRQILRNIDTEVNSFTLDPWNYLWYIKKNELLGESYYLNDKPPNLEIRNILYDNKTADKSSFFKLDLDKEIKLDVSTYYYPSQEKLITQYKLNEGTWNNFNDRLEIKADKSGYNKLYLRVGKDKTNFSTPMLVDFWAEQDIKKTYWPYVIIIVLLVLLLFFYFLRKAKLENQSLLRAKQELNMRLKVLEAEQKQKQSQMSPHFIYNVLNSIKGLIAINENKKARKAINDFAQLMRTVLDDSDKLKIDMQSEIEFLEAYVSLQKMTSSNDFEFEIINNSSAREICPMLIQPFVENAILHGIDSTGKNARIKVMIEDVNHYIKVTIEDSGGKYLAGSKDSDHKSVASEIFLARIDRLDKWKEQVPLKYNVLENGKNDKITQCILHIPKI